MPGNKGLIAVAREWMTKAENDLKTAVHTLDLGEECPTDMVCFHAQQCVEKYLKAVLVLDGIDFPKIHDIGELVALLPQESVNLDITVEEQRRLTEYATVTRYPGDYEPISLVEAREAVGIAKQMRDKIRPLLSKEVLAP